MENKNKQEIRTLLLTLNKNVEMYNDLKKQLDDHKNGKTQLTMVGLKKLECKFSLLSEEIAKINGKLKEFNID